MSDEISSVRPNPYIFDIENRRKRRPRLAHDLGAGAKCKKCEDKCPGFELHFWRKICQNCRCGKDDHEVEDDDEDIGKIVIGKLFDRPPRTRKEELEYCHGNNLEIMNEQTGRAENVKFDWVPPNIEKTLASRYMALLPPEKRPVAGSEAAKTRRRQLEQQLPLYDMDEAQRCDSMAPDELQNFYAYLERIKTQVAGQGMVQEIAGSVPLMSQPLHYQGQSKALDNDRNDDPNRNRILNSENVGDPDPYYERTADPIHSEDNTSGYPRNWGSSALEHGGANAQPDNERTNLRQQFISSMVGEEPGNTVSFRAEQPVYSEPYGGVRGTCRITTPRGGDKHVAGLTDGLSDLGLNANLQPGALRQQYPSQQTQPGQRMLPDQQTLSGHPPLPAQPRRPSHHTYSGQPTLPGQHTLSSQPTLPGQHTLPGHPAHPGHSALPGKQTLPGQPTIPGQHTLPGRPRLPSQHTVSGQPKLPSQSETVGHKPSCQENVAGNEILRAGHTLPSQISVPGQAGRMPAELDYNQSQPTYVPGQKEHLPGHHMYTDQEAVPGQWHPGSNIMRTNPISGTAGNQRDQLHDLTEPFSGANVAENTADNFRSRDANTGAEVMPSQRGKGSLHQMSPKSRDIVAIEATQAPYGARIDTLTAFSEGVSVAPGSDVTVLFPGESQILGSQGKSGNLPAQKSKFSCQYCNLPMDVGDVAIFCERAGPDKCWHPACFCCFTCKELLADLIYFYKDGQVFCGRHFTDAAEIPRCKSCDELIFGNSWTRADGFDWHIHHFCCNVCDKELAGQRYVPDKEGYPYCLPCYMSYLAKMCEACEEKISPEMNRCGQRGYFYHASPECFQCYTCKDPLLGKRFKMSKNWVFCSNECIQAAATDLANNPNSKVKPE